MGKEYRQTLFSAQYVKNGFTNGAVEMKGRVYASCVRCSMTYGSETRPLLVDIWLKFERAEIQMIRRMCV